MQWCNNQITVKKYFILAILNNTDLLNMSIYSNSQSLLLRVPQHSTYFSALTGSGKAYVPTPTSMIKAVILFNTTHTRLDRDTTHRD